MPGITGLITRKPRAWAVDQLERMVASMRHQASYVTGTWIDDAAGVYVGWVARKRSFDAAMPLVTESGNIVLVFSGEEFPDPATKDQLRRHGHQFDFHGPSYLVHRSEEEPDFPSNLNGRFHALRIDRARNAALLFNDRYGMHRLYYHESSDAVYFSAEAKAILEVCSQLRSVDPKGLGEFIACGCTLENRSLFRDIHVLPPGSAWRFENGTLQKKETYFNPSQWESQEPLEPEPYYQQLREVYSRNLPRYFNGQERIGISLTGGLDTRMILAWQKLASQSSPAYTFAGPVRECQDVIIARQVAKICNLEHRVIHIGDDFLSRFPHYAERAVYLSDGCAAANRAPDLYVNEIAAQIAPVRMTGNYGSEILRHLRAFKPVDAAPGLFEDDVLAQVRLARQTFARQVNGHAVSFTAFRQAPWYQYGLLALEQTQVTLRSPFLDNDLVQTAFRAPNAAVVKSDLFEDNGSCARLIRDGNPALRDVRTDRGLGGPPGSWSTPIIRAYQEFTFKAEYAYDYGMPQWLVRIDHALAPFHLERLFLGRHKIAHFRVWYRDALASYIREILLDPRSFSRPYLKPKTLEAMVREHLAGRANYTTEITRLLTLELQHRLFVDRN